jgi:hypothetical protein
VAGARPVEFTLIATDELDDAVAVPAEGVTDSQFPPDKVETEAEKFREPAPPFSTEIDCAGGEVPPCTA